MPRAKIVCCDLGYADYEWTWNLQLKLVELRIQEKVGDLLLLVEHPHVFTLGRKGDEHNILDWSIPVYRIERGGDATYHGPGQMVAYPIIDLNKRGLGVKEFVNILEESCIATLRRLGVEASRVEGMPGVWVGGKKIASIGLAVKHWVTYHGIALNVNTDLSYFTRIRPCGMESSVITSLQKIKGRSYNLDEVKILFKEEFARRLESDIEDVMLESLLPAEAV
ncbi:MAG: lipoyl(octanoyl) transferase LipB [Aigarchaeota archaeon]|nr:lipoyl(octanoyl) transferase LipB [Candidatus Pelearchaeum maunauluense]